MAVVVRVALRVSDIGRDSLEAANILSVEEVVDVVVDSLEAADMNNIQQVEVVVGGVDSLEVVGHPHHHREAEKACPHVPVDEVWEIVVDNPKSS